MPFFKRTYKIVLIVSLAIMLISQVLLMCNFAKPLMCAVYGLEEKYSDSVAETGSIKIYLSDPSDKLYLMQNGEVTEVLSEKEYEIQISDNSVVEINGVKSASCLVKITHISDNLDGYYEKAVTVDKNIVILGRFFVK